MANHLAIVIEKRRIDSGHSLEKEFTELVCMNLRIVLCPLIN